LLHFAEILLQHLDSSGRCKHSWSIQPTTRDVPQPWAFRLSTKPHIVPAGVNWRGAIVSQSSRFWRGGQVGVPQVAAGTHRSAGWIKTTTLTKAPHCLLTALARVCYVGCVVFKQLKVQCELSKLWIYSAM
jgi:hypothetical protein